MVDWRIDMSEGFGDWARCHSFALRMAKPRASIAGMDFLLKISWLRDVQMVQKIQGKRGPLSIPKGGRQVILLIAIIPSLIDRMVEGEKLSLKGAWLHIWAAKE